MTRHFPWQHFESRAPKTFEYVHELDPAKLVIVDIVNLALHPSKPMRVLPHGRLRRWWMKRHGWTLYGPDGQRL